MRKQMLSGLILCMLLSFHLAAQEYVLFKRHDPKKDANLNPFLNTRINPDSNSSINPAFNWNINPIRNNEVNPSRNNLINPVNNLDLNPKANEALNPVFMKSLLPANPSWNGLYLFNKDNEIFGYVSTAS
ncbi:MAG: hypothetical protein ACHQET_13840, partial [Chitinophagales bacterium]